MAVGIVQMLKGELMDLIERQKAIDELISEPPEMNYGFWYAEKIKAIPSAQPEIVRCKECKHRYIENGVWACPFGLPGGELFYCAYGAERRTDAED